MNIRFRIIFLCLTLESSLLTQSHQPPKLSGIIIPGFASTQLRAWAFMDCPYSPLDFKPLDSVWLDSRKLISVTNCWLKCILLDPFNQTDHPECKSRPDTGLSAITEIDPGYIAGAFSSVWREWIHWLVEFGIDANAIFAMPYDWRLPPSELERRDLYFYKLKITFETALKQHGDPSLVFAHSMGNNVFRYFLEWLKFEIAPKLYQQWIDDHIYAYIAVGSPLLGSVESLKGAMSGLAFGLPIPEGTSRLLCNSFGASFWMLPLSKHCHARHEDCGMVATSMDQGEIVCDDREHLSSHSGWPADVAEVHIPEETCTSCSGVSIDGIANGMPECRISTKHPFSAKEIADGTLFREIAHWDPEGERAIYQLKKFYLNDQVLNALTPWRRPPIRNIFCTYGINLKTEVGYHFAPSGKPYPDNWLMTDVIYEVEGGGLQSRSGANVVGNPGPASGDDTLSFTLFLQNMAWPSCECDQSTSDCT